MKQAILTILSRLINAMRTDSLPYHSLVLPIIKGAVEPGSETQVYLLDDALDLWSAVVAQTPAPASSDLLSLAPYLIQILELGSETFRKAVEIIESYVLLAPADMLSDSFRTPLITSLASLLGKLRTDANGVVTHLVEIMIRAAHSVAGEPAVQIVVGDMVSSGFFAKLMEGLRGAWGAHQHTGPRASENNVDGIIETDYFSVLARIGTTSPQILLEAVNAAIPNESIETSMKWLLEEWFSHFENIGDSARRKLMTIVLTRLLGINAEWILIKLQDLMVIWTDVVLDLTDGFDDKSIEYVVRYPAASYYADNLVTSALVYKRSDLDDSALAAPSSPESPEDARRRDVLYSDPVHTINIVALIREQMKNTIQAQGGEQRFQEEWLVNVDREVVEGFTKTGIM
jgi:hypothetical protein